MSDAKYLTLNNWRRVAVRVAVPVSGRPVLLFQPIGQTPRSATRRLVPALLFAGQTAVTVVRETGKQILLPAATSKLSTSP